jgi:hypothetical protein
VPRLFALDGDFLKRFAEHNDRSTDEVWAEFKLSAGDLERDPLS